MRCITHPKIFDCERIILPSGIKSASWRHAQICYNCEKKIAEFHYSKMRPGKHQTPINRSKIREKISLLESNQ